MTDETAYVTRREFEARIRVLEGEVAGEKTVTRYILEQTRRNGDDLATLTTESALNRATLTSHTALLNVLVQDVGLMRNEMGAMRTSQGRVEHRLDRLEQRFDGLEQTVGTMRSDMNTMRGDINTMRGDMDMMRGDIAAIRAALTPRDPPADQH